MRVGTAHNWLQNAQKHPGEMHNAFDDLKKGECLAPTSLQWEACTIKWNGLQWVDDQPVKFSGYEGIENGIFPNSWN